MLTGLNSTPSDGATAWMTANWPMPGAMVGIPKDRRSRHARRDLFEQFQPFPAHAVFENHKAGGVAARPRQAIDVAGADRIGDDRRTRSARCGSPAATAPSRWRQQARMTSGASATNSAACLRISVGIARGPAGVDPHVAADGPAQLLQPLQECPDAGLNFRIVCASAIEHADAAHASRPAARARQAATRPPRRREA